MLFVRHRGFGNVSPPHERRRDAHAAMPASSRPDPPPARSRARRLPARPSARAGSDWHAFWAAWNCGELGSIPLGPPFAPDSYPDTAAAAVEFRIGEVGDPVGAHALRRTSAPVPASWPVPPGSGLPSLGALAHAFSAAWNWARFWLIRSVAVVVAAGMSMWPSVGSGNSGSPWVRMHCENSTIFCWAAALLSGEDEPPPPGSSRWTCWRRGARRPGSRRSPAAGERAARRSQARPR